MNNGHYVEAANLAATAPHGILRTSQTLRTLQTTYSNGTSLSLFDFTALLERGSLNKHETIKLVRPVLDNVILFYRIRIKLLSFQGRLHLIEKWIAENKLDYSEELGDLVKPHHIKLALKIYLRGNVHHKVVQCFSELRQFDDIIIYSKKVNYQPDYLFQLHQILRTRQEVAGHFAQTLITDISPSGEPLADINKVLSRIARITN